MSVAIRPSSEWYGQSPHSHGGGMPVAQPSRPNSDHGDVIGCGCGCIVVTLLLLVVITCAAVIIKWCNILNDWLAK